MSRFRRDEGGQAVVELSLVLVPIVLILLFGLVELGTTFHHTLTISAASREGARVGGALVNGGGTLGCSGGQSPNAATVDPNVVASIERVFTGTGALVKLADVTEIRLWKSTSTGLETAGKVNVWTYTPGAGPLVGGERLNYSQLSAGWPACERNNVNPADSMGVTIRYTYRSQTPFGWLIPGLATIPVAERSVMPLNASR